jgi:tripartite-type tricarboxylate transporter receptor subunit TctC
VGGLNCVGLADAIGYTAIVEQGRMGLAMTRDSFGGWAAIGLAVALGTTSANAQAPDDFFKGRTITVYIGFGPGGTYDLYARLLARHMGKHIPGNPGFVAQSMPGAGSITLANFLFNVAPKDGTAIGTIAQAVAVEEALKSSGIGYKVSEFSWVGRAAPAVELLMSWHTSKAKRIEDTRVHDTPTAGTGPASPSEGIPRLLNATYGSRFRIISGYPSSAVALTAMEKGEVDTAQTSWSTVRGKHQNWIRDKQINILSQGTLTRIPDLPDVPAVAELGRTEDDKKLLAFYISSAEVGRSFVAPPGLPPARLAILRRAFDATMQDAQFKAEVEKAGAEVLPMTGEKLQALMTETVKAPPELVARMKSILDAKK